MPIKENTALNEKTKIKIPKMYKVIFYNDDFTPMDFVVELLIAVFGKDSAEAEKIMLSIHRSDKAVVGIYTRDIACTKAAEATAMAKQAGYPLKITAEAE